MNHNEWENDSFDQLLRDALASDAAPSEDFTARLMEQVRRTPQQKAKNRPYKKILAAVAACAVIAVAIPLVMPHGNSTASADNAAPMMDMNADDGAADMDSAGQYTMGAPRNGSDEVGDPASQKQVECSEYAEEPGTPHGENVQAVTLVGQDANDARAALDEMGIQPAKTENNCYTYGLTEQQAQELGKTVMALYNVEGDLILILEVTE